MERLQLDITDIFRLAAENPDGTAITSAVEEYQDANGDDVKAFYILSR